MEKIDYEKIIIKTKTNDLFFDFQKVLDIDEDNNLDLEFFSTIPLKKYYKNRIEKDELLPELLELYSTMEIDRDFFESLFTLNIIGKIKELKIKQYSKTLDQMIEYLIPRINKFVEENVDPAVYKSPKDLEEMNTVSKRELYFSDEHLKLIIKISILSKFFFPLMNDKLDVKYRNKIISKVWDAKFEDIDKKVNIKNKIQKFSYSRLYSVIYSDKRFWNIAKLHNITPLGYANTLYIKILNSAISFLSWNNNPIPFIDVFINNNIKWLKKKKFTQSYNIINSDIQELTTVNYQTRISTKYQYTNLTVNFVIQETCYQFLEKELSSYFERDSFYGETLELIRNNIKRNMLFNYLVFPFISKKLKISTDRLLLLNKDLLSFFVLYTVIELTKNNFPLLTQMLLSNVTTDKMFISKQKAESYKPIASVLNEPKYKELVNEKYSKFKDMIEGEKHFLKMIATLYYNRFEPYTSVDHEGEVLRFSVEELVEEILRFYTTMV